MAEENRDDIYTLVDENGKDIPFRLLARAPFEGKEYFVLEPVEPDEDFEEGDRVILRLESVDEDEDGDATLVTIDDDDEFDRVADFFDDMFFDEVDYDDAAKDDEKKEN